LAPLPRNSECQVGRIILNLCDRPYKANCNTSIRGGGRACRGGGRYDPTQGCRRQAVWCGRAVSDGSWGTPCGQTCVRACAQCGRGWHRRMPGCSGASADVASATRGVEGCGGAVAERGACADGEASPPQRTGRASGTRHAVWTGRRVRASSLRRGAGGRQAVGKRFAARWIGFCGADRMNAVTTNGERTA